MKRYVLLLALLSTSALASDDPVADTRRIMAGTVTTTRIKNEYLSGLRDGTTAFKGALAAYKAVRAAEQVPLPIPLPIDPLKGEVPVLSNFDIRTQLEPAQVPPSAAPDVVGAFRFICQAGQLSYDDPIVYPGQPGKSHLHQFYGNLAANAFSNFNSLRTTGDSTCMNPLNRSAYWQPAMLDGKGNVIRPGGVSIYYKRRPKGDPVVSDPANPRYEGKAVDLPNGLKFIFGYDMLTGQAPTGSFDYLPVKGGQPIGSPYPTLAKLAASGLAQPGTQIWARIHAPQCWDGKNLDSPNHRDHVAYKVRNVATGHKYCPATHPYVIPEFQLTAIYDVVTGDDVSLWRLSSDDHVPGAEAGSTFHADFWMAWDPTVKTVWHTNCLDKMLNCSAGVLGDGTIMKRWSGYSLVANPRLVPVPSGEHVH